MKNVTEKAYVVFKETSVGCKFEVLKTQDGQLKLGGVYSEDLVEFYAKNNDGVIVLNYSGEVVARNIAEPAPEPLKVGDYAKVISDEYDDMPVGTIVKIATVDNSDNPHQGVRLGTDETDLDIEEFNWFEVGHLEKVSEIEALKLDQEAKIEAKWASINRKPNEFKIGDIVTDKSTRARFTVLSFCEIEDSIVNFSDGSELMSNIKLIAPVEARFDLSSKGDR